MDMRSVFVLALGLAGCAVTSETVYLENAQGERVQCGPYTGDIAVIGTPTPPGVRLRDCIDDFQRQGYERVQGPQ